MVTQKIYTTPLHRVAVDHLFQSTLMLPRPIQKSEQSCLENNSQEDEYFCDIFSTELKLDETSNKSTDYSSSNHQYPEQLELHNYKLLNKIGKGHFPEYLKQ